jgi:hypothetical protein
MLVEQKKCKKKLTWGLESLLLQMLPLLLLLLVLQQLLSPFRCVEVTW